MLTNLLLLILEAFSGFFVFLLLVRFHMQWLRISFRNRIGQFVTALTNWLVHPLRKLIPGFFGLDWASLAGALLLHGTYLTIAFWLKHFAFGDQVGVAIPVILAIALIELLRFSIYLLIAVILVSAALSWFNPHAPLAPLFFSMARPFLRPFQRLIPPIAQIDLSPLFLLLILQMGLMLIDWLRVQLIPLIV